MSQSTFIAGALIAGFVLFLAARNRLSTYAAVLWGSTAAPVPQPTIAQGAASAASQATSGFSKIFPFLPGNLQALPILPFLAP
jgi:hypothetical protein